MSLTDLYASGRWIVAKYHSACPCGKYIIPGDDLWYVPYQKKGYCSTCKKQTYPKELKDLLDISY